MLELGVKLNVHYTFSVILVENWGAILVDVV